MLHFFELSRSCPLVIVVIICCPAGVAVVVVVVRVREGGVAVDVAGVCSVAAVAGIAAVKVTFEVDAVVGFVPAALMEVGRLAGSGMDYQLDN